MFQRTITGIIIAIVFVIPFVMGSEWFLVFAGIVALVAYREYAKMIKIQTFGLTWIIGAVGLSIMYITQTTTLVNEGMDAIIGVLVMLLILTVVKENFAVERAGALLIGVMYIGFGVASIASIREEKGFEWAVTIIVGICIVDIFAYLVGRKFGKTKLAEKISPKKTIEGSVGGSIIATIVIFGIQYFLAPFDSYLQTGLVAFIIVVFGQLGDLIESGIKRRYQVKDSGRILPGHGGVFDRIDSWLTVFILLNLIF